LDKTLLALPLFPKLPSKLREKLRSTRQYTFIVFSSGMIKMHLSRCFHPTLL